MLKGLFWFFKTGFLCVTVLAVLELALVDQSGLELTEIHLPLPPVLGLKVYALHLLRVLALTLIVKRQTLQPGVWSTKILLKTCRAKQSAWS